MENKPVADGEVRAETRVTAGLRGASWNPELLPPGMKTAVFIMHPREQLIFVLHGPVSGEGGLRLKRPSQEEAGCSEGHEDTLGTADFVFDFMTRTGRISEKRLRAEFPRFMSRYREAWEGFKGSPHGEMLLRVRGLVV